MIALRRVYCDHSATTPVHPEVAQAMMAYLTEEYGNPSSIHAFGRRVRKGVEDARQQVSQLINARPVELFFTSGGTEADNWAIRGAAYANRARGNHIITTAVEHHAVLDCCQALEKEGFAVTYLPVEPETGFVRQEDLLGALRPETILVSVMFVNNEIGTIQPIKALCAAVKAHDPKIVFHTDAVQAAGVIPVDVKDLGVDMLTLSAHKIYGPKGIGALYVKKGFRFQAVQVGGGQERKMRSGTENVTGIVGFGKAAELAGLHLAERAAHQRALRDRFWEQALARVEGAQPNGPDPALHPDGRHPGNANIAVQHVDGEAMLLRLDMQGVACSAGSACTAGSLEPSHVLLAIGLSHEMASSSLRFTFGEANTADDVDHVVEQLVSTVRFLRSLAPSGA